MHMQISMLQALLFAVIFFSVAEWILQAFWVQSYFRRGIFLRAKTLKKRRVLIDRVDEEQNEYLRNFELKRICGILFAIRQGKFGISRTIFFHGFATIDAQSLDIRINIFINLNWIIFSALLGLLVAEHNWWGAVCMVIFAWTIARYFVDDTLMVFIADRVQMELEHDKMSGI